MSTYRHRVAAPRHTPASRKYRIPGEVPTLPFHDYATVNPGLMSVPTIDLVALAGRRAEDEDAEKDTRFNTLKAAKDFWSIAGANPEVAGEIGDVVESRGLPAYGRALRGVRDEAPDLSGPTRPPTLPGDVPELPGGPSLPDIQDEYGKRLSKIVATFKKARPDIEHEDHVKAATEYLQRTPAWSAYKAQAEAYGRERGQYEAKLDQEHGEPALVKAKRTAERDEDMLDIPVNVSESRRKKRAEEEEHTGAEWDRGLNEDALQRTLHMPRRLFEKTRESDIQFRLDDDRKTLEHATGGDIEEEKAAGRERGKRRLGGTKDPAAAAAKAAEAAFEKDRTLAHKDMELWTQSSAGRNSTPEEQRRYELEQLRFRRNQRAHTLAQVGTTRGPQAAREQVGSAPAPAPSADSLATHLGLPVAKVKEIMRLAREGTPDEQAKAQRILAGQAKRRQ